MNSILLLYDSAYGNTEKIAVAIGNTIGVSLDPQSPVPVLRVDQVSPDYFEGLKLLVVGSPTQRFRPTTKITNFLKSLPPEALQGVKVAAFDTRLTEDEINQNRVLAFFVRLYGYAASPIAKLLRKKGGELILPPEGFYVEGMEGPLVAGELERAIAWANRIESQIFG